MVFSEISMKTSKTMPTLTLLIIYVAIMISRRDQGQPSFNNLRFIKDLTTADKALREKLWPWIDATKKEGKKAHIAGIRVIIEGKDVHHYLH